TPPSAYEPTSTADNSVHPAAAAASAVLPAATGALERPVTQRSHPPVTSASHPSRKRDGQRRSPWPRLGRAPHERSTPAMTEPKTRGENTAQRIGASRETARREAVRLARDSGAQTVTRPMFRGDKEPTVRDVEPLAGARASRDIELAAKGTARDYIRQAREAG